MNLIIIELKDRDKQIKTSSYSVYHIYRLPFTVVKVSNSPVFHDLHHILSVTVCGRFSELQLRSCLHKNIQKQK